MGAEIAGKRDAEDCESKRDGRKVGKELIYQLGILVAQMEVRSSDAVAVGKFNKDTRNCQISHLLSWRGRKMRPGVGTPGFWSWPVRP